MKKTLQEIAIEKKALIEALVNIGHDICSRRDLALANLRETSERLVEAVEEAAVEYSEIEDPEERQRAVDGHWKVTSRRERVDELNAELEAYEAIETALAKLA